ncbi:MAG: class I adenylate-forming enzyme family protein [Geminicoccaceae bacterium]
MNGPGPSYRPLDIASGVRANADRLPDKTALRQGEVSLTYSDLGARMNRLANGIVAAGVTPGSTIALLSANRPEYFDVVAGASSMGAAVATINPRQTETEIAAILDDCDPKLIFSDPASAEKVRASTKARVHIFGDAYEDWLKRASDRAPNPLPEEWETFAIPYTSGTTGQPKGVCLSHRSRVISFFVFASIYGCFGPRDRFLVTTPLFHGGGFAFPMASLFLGGEVELMPAYAPDILLDRMTSGGNTGTFVVPTQLHGLFDLPERDLARLSEHNFRSIICNAAPLPEETKHKALEHFGDGCLHETYGSTEAGVVTNLYPDEMRRKQNCAGRPIAGQHVRLLGEDGAPVAASEIGELFSNGPTLFNGYLNKPEETAASFRDGWFSAGDLAREDEEGFIHIMDRKKDMILSGGVNIYPRDIEEVLYTLPGIAEAAVVGVPDRRWGEAVCAFLRPVDTPPEEQAVLAACRAGLAPHKVPKTIRFVEEIPRNAAGKVLKRALRNRWEVDA